MPDSSKETLEERKKEDSGRVKKLVQKVSDIPEDAVGHPVRLGQIHVGRNSRPRLLRMEIKSEEEKRKLMKNVYHLNTERTDPTKKIYINNDSTSKERDQFHILREEMKRRREEGENDLVIRGVKILKRTTKRSPDGLYS